MRHRRPRAQHLAPDLTPDMAPDMATAGARLCSGRSSWGPASRPGDRSGPGSALGRLGRGRVTGLGTRLVAGLVTGPRDTVCGLLARPGNAVVRLRLARARRGEGRGGG